MSIEIVFFVVGGVAFVLNIVESTLILKMRKNWKHFDRLLLSLSIADLIVAIATIMANIGKIDGMPALGNLLSKRFFFIVLFTSQDYSVLHILAITVDRFMAVKHPLKHNMRMQGHFPAMTIAGIWVSVFALNVVLISIITTYSNLLLPIGKAFSVLFILLGLCYAAAYRHIFRTALNQATRRSKKFTDEEHKNCSIKKVLLLEKCRNERNLLITCCLVLSSYLICMFPISVETLVKNSAEDITVISQLLLIGNSILNPIVYFFKGLRERRMKNVSYHRYMKNTTHGETGVSTSSGSRTQETKEI